MLGFFRPTKYATRISQIDPEELRARGIRGAICDLDNTLVGFRTLAPLEEDAAWVRRAHVAGVQVAVLTNNGTPWASEVAKELGVPCIPRARKPLPHGFRRAVRVLELEADQCVVIGDQLFTDVLGAKLAGLEVILVDPLVRHDPWNTRPLRWLERIVMRGVPRV
ncbi:MAG: putative phosphatase [Candidatus Eremiobacteraeota bacterium]|jgi:HAD superfamily phosphatase (TIGR01668 family)|nr:putative phosphatase [Candidatus Eremiobacteraeota bacterium]